MNDFFHSFVLTFLPLFIVVDVIGNIPIVMSLSEGMTSKQRFRLINLALITATVVGLVFLFFGKFILDVMGISQGAFTIAGGLVLLIFSLRYLTSGRWMDIVKEEMIAIVPIGTPLIVGPATITTLLLLATEYPLYIILLSLALNLLISWIAFLAGNRISGFLGKGGLSAVSQVFNLLLVAIAVTMIIKGLDLSGIINIVK
ncbi:MAG: MarC family protein [Dehalococcoidales bacterium]|nr:MarC family protein [Dehalococcoidales bacterium]